MKFNHKDERHSTKLLSELPVSVEKQDWVTPATWSFVSGLELESFCLSCVDEPCRRLSPDEVRITEVEGLAGDNNLEVCPTGAISWDSVGETPQIAEDQCVSCGLCALRCPVGAIQIGTAGAEINVSGPDNGDSQLLPLDDSKKRQRSQIANFPRIDVMHPLDSDRAVIEVSSEVSKLGEEAQMRTVRNFLVQAGATALVRRKGLSGQRMDGFYQFDGAVGPIEIEFGFDGQEAIRGILDDVATVHVKHGFHKEKQHPVVIFGALLTRRQEYWQLLRDARSVLDLQVATLTLGALILLAWNGKPITKSLISAASQTPEQFTIRTAMEMSIGRPIDIPTGEGSVLEPRK